MRRRSLLAAAGATFAGVDGRVTLRGEAAATGLLTGSSSEIDLAHDPAYAALIAANVSLFAPNMSWQRMSPTPDEAWAGLDPNIAAAERAGLQLTGYHLLWHQRLPAWLAGLDRAAAERAIVEHVGRIGARFGAQTWSWNVVNEAIRPADGRADGLRRSALSAAFGDRFFDLAFDAARAAAPQALRVYNDYDLELATQDQEARRGVLLRLLDGLARRSVPIQAVGLQSHLRTRSFDRFEAGAFRRFLAELAARDLDVLITELDVHDLATGSVAERDAAVAAVYRRFLETALAERRVRSVVFWGLGDRYSWLNDGGRADYARPDGLSGRPLPFDPALAPTAAFGAVVGALRGAPWR